MEETPDKAPVRVRFAPGETDTMPIEQAEFVLTRLYSENMAARKRFAKYMQEYWLQRPGSGRVE
jgi:hypothetical protein